MYTYCNNVAYIAQYVKKMLQCIHNIKLTSMEDVDYRNLSYYQQA